MDDSDSEFSRLPAGGPPTDDPELAEFADFLAELRQAYPPTPVDHVREAHLAAIVEEAGRQPVAATTPRRRRVARRTVAVASVAALSVLSAGVGVAAAMGADPFALLPGLRLGPPDVPPAATPTPDEPTPTTPPPPVAAGPTHAARPTTPGVGNSSAPGQAVREQRRDWNNGKSGNGNAGKGKSDEAKTGNGRSDEAQAEHKPTAKPTQASGRTDPPAKGRSTAKPSTPADRGKAGG